MAKGKSGADSGKRVKKLMHANANAVSQGSIRRLARRGGVKRIAATVYPQMRDVLKGFVEAIVKDATAYTEHAKMKTVTVGHCVQALRKRGKALYGY